MPIHIYATRYSPPCRAVLMTAKQLNIDLNLKTIHLNEGQHLTEDYLKINPAHSIPTIDDNGFILWESRAIMQYLCNRYAPDSPLYPTDATKRALVDRWLNFDHTLTIAVRDACLRPYFMGVEPTEQSLKVFNDTMKLLDELIGNKKYLNGNHLTIADLSVLATTYTLKILNKDMTPFPNFKTWITGLTAEFPYVEEINKFDENDIKSQMNKTKTFFLEKLSKK
ncbi:unnamed protein product [Oppiella nova]|uniref:Glutathione S-transferase n=1 Tax=Oppiella nova TaxID=334625 RepID=A0A7R9QLZ9_9ACAR|nr:unnamed protein product [Oppiella nova]CAG2167956.1 unnamed protein product [Oppiella nova]